MNHFDMMTFNIGRVVALMTDNESDEDKRPYQEYKYGHIIGFDINSAMQTILRIKWDDGTESLRHPTQIIY